MVVERLPYTGAAFMQMKEDRTRNDTDYNIKIALKSEYITGIEAFSNRTGGGISTSFMYKLVLIHKQRYEVLTADAG